MVTLVAIAPNASRISKIKHSVRSPGCHPVHHARRFSMQVAASFCTNSNNIFALPSAAACPSLDGGFQPVVPVTRYSALASWSKNLCLSVPSFSFLVSARKIEFIFINCATSVSLSLRCAHGHLLRWHFVSFTFFPIAIGNDVRTRCSQHAPLELVPALDAPATCDAGLKDHPRMQPCRITVSPLDNIALAQVWRKNAQGDLGPRGLVLR